MTLEQLNRGIQLQNEIWKLEKLISDIKEYGSFTQDYTRIHISPDYRDKIITMFGRELNGLKREFVRL